MDEIFKKYELFNPQNKRFAKSIAFLALTFALSYIYTF